MAHCGPVQITLQSILAQILVLEGEYSRGQLEYPEFLTMEMIKGMVTTLQVVGFNDPEIRKEPLVDRIQASYSVLYDARAQRVAREMLILLNEHGFKSFKRRVVKT